MEMLVRGASSGDTKKKSALKKTKQVKSGSQPYKLNPLVEFAAANTAGALKEVKKTYGVKVVSGTSKVASSKAAARTSVPSSYSSVRTNRASVSSAPSLPPMPQGSTLEETLWKHAAEEALRELETRKKSALIEYEASQNKIKEEEAQAQRNIKMEMAKRGLLSSTLKTDADYNLQQAVVAQLADLEKRKNLTIDDINRQVAQIKKQTAEKIAASKFERSLKEWQIKADLAAWLWKTQKSYEIQAAYSPRSGNYGGGSSSSGSKSTKPPISYQAALKMLRQADKDYYNGNITGTTRGEIYRQIGAVYPELVKKIPKIIPKKKSKTSSGINLRQLIE